MTGSPQSNSPRHAGRAWGLAAVVALASLLAWTAWHNATLRAERSALQQENDVLRQSLRGAAPAVSPAVPLVSTQPAATPPLAAAPAPVARADPLAPLVAPARGASGPSLEGALEALRERAPAPRTSPFGAAAGARGS